MRCRQARSACFTIFERSMNKFVFILGLLIPNMMCAQQYNRSEIKHAADSILKTFIGMDMFAHCSNELNSGYIVYYRYADKKGKIKFAEVPEKGYLTKGEFKGIEVWYKMVYPYPRCTVCDTTRGELSVKLNRWLDMEKAPDIGWIPDYIMERDSCRYTNRNYQFNNEHDRYELRRHWWGMRGRL